MPTVQCPKCGGINHLDTATYWNYKGTYRCSHCGRHMRVRIVGGELQETPQVLEFVGVTGAPAEVNLDFIEAQKCYDVEAYKATVVMCRRTLETMATLQGATGKNLLAKIKDLYNKDMSSKGTFNIATQVRQFGNYGAHPKNDLLGEITKNDAAVVLEVTQHLLKDVYEIPEKVDALKKRLQK